MDKLDQKLLMLLKKDARMSILQLANDLGVTRATARTRLERLIESGEIAGFTVLTRSDVNPHEVRGMMCLEIEGRNIERVAKQMRSTFGVQAVHATNGVWDLIVELGSDSLQDFDDVLTRVRRIDGIKRSETSLLLSTLR